MRWKKVLPWLAVLLVIAGCLTASFLEFYHPRPPCEDCFYRKQVLHLPAPGITDIRTLDPANATDIYSAQFAGVVFPGLVALDKNLTAVPWAATALPDVSADGKTWTFHVRPGLKWSDGAPIDATTYAFSINRAENPCNAFGAAYYLYAIKDAAAFNSETCDTSNNTIKGPLQTLLGDSIAAPDKLTLQITLARPAIYFLSAMTYPTSYAVPEQLVNTYGNNYTEHLEDGAGIGGDMFKVVKWDHAGHLVLRRNSAFWGRQPVLREVDITFVGDVNQAYAGYQAGKEDVGYAPVAQLAAARQRAGFHQIATQRIDYFAMNWKMAPFNDLRMRQAFAIALDKTALANHVSDGAVVATNHIVPSGMPGYNPNLLGPDGTAGLAGNTTLANQLATQYATETKCGTATDFSKCPRVTLTLFDSAPDLQVKVEAAEQMWLKAMPNYPLSVTTCCDTLLTTTSARNFQFSDMSWIGDYPDPQDWLSTNLLCDSAYNNGSACDKQADALMNWADSSPDQGARLQLYQRAEQILVSQVAWVPLDQATTWWETQPRLHNFTIAADGLVPHESWQTMYLTP